MDIGGDLERLGMLVEKRTRILAMRNYQWCSADVRSSVADIRNRIDKVRGLLERENRTDAHWVGIENEFAAMSLAFKVWQGLAEKHPECRSAMELIDRKLHPEQLLARLKADARQVAEELAAPRTAASDPPATERQFSRRKFLGWAAGVGAAAVAAKLTPRIIEELFIPPDEAFAPPPAPHTWAEPGFYVQAGALPTLESAREHAAGIGSGFKVHEVPEGAYRFKVLWSSQFISPEEAEEWIVAEEEEGKLKIPVEVGIVTVLPGGSTAWQKTLGEEVLEAGKTLPPAPPFHDLVLAAVERYPLFGEAEKDAYLVHALITVESRTNPRAKSPKGAMGLMQLMPITWKETHKAGNTFYKHTRLLTSGIGHVCDPYDPAQNIDAGVRHLSGLFRRYPVDPAKERDCLRRILRMYNAGVRSVLTGRADKSRENREYPGKVQAALARFEG